MDVVFLTRVRSRVVLLLLALVCAVPVLAAPVAVDDTLYCNEDTALTFAPLANDSGDGLRVAWVGGQDNGTWTLNADSTVTFQPFPNNLSPAHTYYSIQDATGAYAYGHIFIIMRNVDNDPPVACDGSYTAGAAGVSGTLYAYDPDNTPTTVRLASQPALGTVTLLDAAKGTFTYVPNAGAEGADSFTFIASDGVNDSNIATVRLTVKCNHAPVAQDDTLDTDEDWAVSSYCIATDQDGNPLTYRIISQGTKGTVTINPGTPTFTYVPKTNANGVDSFTFVANDGMADSNVATITVTIAPVNDAPSAAGLALTTPEDTPITFLLPASDPDGDPLTVTITQQPISGTVTVDAATMTFTFTPGHNAVLRDGFKYTVSDGTATTLPAYITITTTPVNDAPTASNAILTTSEDNAATGKLFAVDVDYDSLTYRFVTLPTKGTVTFTDATGNYRYTPNAEVSGSDSFTFVANDGTVDSNVATVSITINPVNDPPVSGTLELTTVEDTAVSGTLPGSDVEGGPLNFWLSNTGSKGIARITNAATGAFTYTPYANATGTDTVIYRVSDGVQISAAGTVTITITPVNDVPTAKTAVLYPVEDTALTGTLAGTDPDGDALTYIIASEPLKGTLELTDPATGAFTYTPDPNATGNDSFTFRVCDGVLTSSPAIINLIIQAVNDAPTAQNGTLAVTEDTLTPGVMPAVDVDNDTLTYLVVTPPAKGTVTVYSYGNFQYRPAANATGSDSFTFQVRDSAGVLSNVATMSIIINPVNDAPVVTNLNLTMDEDGTLTGVLPGSDPDGDALSFRVNTQSLLGVAAITNPATGAFTFTPNPNRTGATTFTFSAFDGALTSNTGVVTITITALNDAPVATNSTVNATEDTTATGTMQAADAENDALTFRVVTPPAKGTLVVTNASTGAFTYTPNANVNGTDSFTFAANDGKVDSNIATLTLSIYAVNDAPVAVADTATTTAGTPVVIPVLANDTDVEGNTLALVGIPLSPAHGSVSISSDYRTITYVPVAGYGGPDSFTYQMADGFGGGATGTVSVLVTAPPTVTLSVPATSFTAPASIALTATAADADGSITKVEFFNGSTLLATDTTAPYAYTWTGVANGRYTLTAKAYDNSGLATVSTPVAVVVYRFKANINFQPATAAVPAGYLVDSGLKYGARNGLTYGWTAANTKTIYDRNASNSPDQRYDTCITTQQGGTFTWEIAVPAGTYTVHLVAGDATTYAKTTYKFAAESTTLINGVPTSAVRWIEGTANIAVSDGKLTISNVSGASNNKLCFIDITSVE
jgi:VCBS repeat-containing protein